MMTRLLMCMTMLWMLNGVGYAQTLDGSPNHPPIIHPFDLGFHGVNFDVADFFIHQHVPHVMVYEPSRKVAALVNLSTCIAQVQERFNAGIPGPPLVWKQVQHLTDLHFVWNHGGAWWSHEWPTGLPTMDFGTIIINDPRLGPGTALCRMRP